MSLPKVSVRSATREDIEAFSRAEFPTMKAWCGEVDGRLIGLGGFYFLNGRWVGFCDLTEEARRYKMTLVKIGKEAIRGMEQSGHKFIYAEIDENEPMAKKWVESLGFRHDVKTGLHKWRSSEV